MNQEIKSDNIYDTSKSNAYSTTAQIMAETMKVTTREHPDNLFLTIKADEIKRQHLVRKLTLKDEFLYAHSWRNYASTGDIHRLFVENADYHFIVVGPFFYKNFGCKISLKNFSLIEISETRGCDNINRTIAQIVALRNSIKDKKVICLCSAGGISAFLISKLHELLTETFIIDVGRALDAYYCHDDVLIKGPHWRWSKAWFGDKGTLNEWTKWTKQYKL